MGKILALDLGDQWVGVAISDISRNFARPYTTIEAAQTESFLAEAIKKEQIDLVVVGYPKTMKGGESSQTKKIVEHTKKLEEGFPSIQFVLWDERLSSQRAQTVSSAKSREDKRKSHAIAAAFILDSYILFLQSSQERMANDY